MLTKSFVHGLADVVGRLDRLLRHFNLLVECEDLLFFGILRLFRLLELMLDIEEFLCQFIDLLLKVCVFGEYGNLPIEEELLTVLIDFARVPLTSLQVQLMSHDQADSRQRGLSLSQLHQFFVIFIGGCNAITLADVLELLN